MADIEAVEVLTQAKERLFEYGWGTGSSDHRPDGSMCLEEACVGERGRYLSSHKGIPSLFGRVERYLSSALDDRMPFCWNDDQESAGPGFDALDRAIEIAKEAPNPS